mmetsp:Transcript_37214/g.93449  ORF Transcript_37214/g.93449 Transcript_37214/m.93449 type:complete len:212 (-) Transcript_37214:82-717(-)
MSAVSPRPSVSPPRSNQCPVITYSYICCSRLDIGSNRNAHAHSDGAVGSWLGAEVCLVVAAILLVSAAAGRVVGQAERAVGVLPSLPLEVVVAGAHDPLHKEHLVPQTRRRHSLGAVVVKSGYSGRQLCIGVVLLALAELHLCVWVVCLPDVEDVFAHSVLVEADAASSLVAAARHHSRPPEQAAQEEHTRVAVLQGAGEPGNWIAAHASI